LNLQALCAAPNRGTRRADRCGPYLASVTVHSLRIARKAPDGLDVFGHCTEREAGGRGVIAQRSQQLPCNRLASSGGYPPVVLSECAKTATKRASAAGSRRGRRSVLLARQEGQIVRDSAPRSAGPSPRPATSPGQRRAHRPNALDPTSELGSGHGLLPRPIGRSNRASELQLLGALQSKKKG